MHKEPGRKKMANGLISSYLRLGRHSNTIFRGQFVDGRGMCVAGQGPQCSKKDNSANFVSSKFSYTNFFSEHRTFGHRKLLVNVNHQNIVKKPMFFHSVLDV